MEVLGFLRPYRKKIERKFHRERKRRQLNFMCDHVLCNLLQEMAKSLECPIYVIAEHVLEMGTGDVLILLQDMALKEELQRHLVEDHLLVEGLKPPGRHVSRRLQQIQNVLRIVSLIEQGVPGERVAEALDRLRKDAGADSRSAD